MPNPEVRQPYAHRPLDEVIAELREWQADRDGPIWFAGHGTEHAEAQDLFSDGVIIGSHDSLLEATVPLEYDDNETLRNELDHWPHRDSKRVVLLAAPSPEDFDIDGPPHRNYLWMDGLIQKTDKWGRQVNHIPGSRVLGVYSRETGSVAMNPGFELREVSAEEMENSGGIRYTLATLGGTALDAMGAAEPEIPPSVEPAARPSSDTPIIW